MPAGPAVGRRSCFGIAVLVDLIVGKVKKRRPEAVRIICAVCGSAFAIVTGLALYVLRNRGGMGIMANGTAIRGRRPSHWRGACANARLLLRGEERCRKTSCILYGLFACVALLEAVFFISIGVDFIMQIIAWWCARCHHPSFIWKKEGKEVSVVIFICIAIAVLISRYAFYVVAGV